MTVHSYSSILAFFLISGCGSKDAPSSSIITDSLDSRNERASVIPKENEVIPKDYCIVRTNYTSFDFHSEKDFIWTINGHKITVDSLKEFKVTTHGGLDTLIFEKPARSI